MDVIIGGRSTIKADLARGRLVETENQTEQGCLAYAAGPHKGDMLSRTNRNETSFSTVPCQRRRRDTLDSTSPFSRSTVRPTPIFSSGTMSKSAETRSSEARAFCSWRWPRRELGRAKHVSEVGLEGEEGPQAPMVRNHPITSERQDQDASHSRHGIDHKVGNIPYRRLL